MHPLAVAGGGQHAGADGAGHLDHARAHPARAAADEHRLARLQLCIAEQTQVGRDAHQRHGGGVLVGDFLGRGIKPALVDGGIFGERPLAAQQPLIAPPDPVAFAIFRRRRADRLDHPGQVAADNKRLRQVHRIHAGADVRIDRIDGHRLDLDEHLAVARLRLGQSRRK